MITDKHETKIIPNCIYCKSHCSELFLLQVSDWGVDPRFLIPREAGENVTSHKCVLCGSQVGTYKGILGFDVQQPGLEEVTDLSSWMLYNYQGILTHPLTPWLGLVRLKALQGWIMPIYQVGWLGPLFLWQIPKPTPICLWVFLLQSALGKPLSHWIFCWCFKGSPMWKRGEQRGGSIITPCKPTKIAYGWLHITRFTQADGWLKWQGKAHTGSTG